MLEKSQIELLKEAQEVHRKYMEKCSGTEKAIRLAAVVDILDDVIRMVNGDSLPIIFTIIRIKDEFKTYRHIKLTKDYMI